MGQNQGSYLGTEPNEEVGATPKGLKLNQLSEQNQGSEINQGWEPNCGMGLELRIEPVKGTCLDETIPRCGIKKLRTNAL